MATSFLKHTKKRFLPMGLGAVCVFLAVDKIIIFLLIVALLISLFKLTLQIVNFLFTNKALIVVANFLKPLKASYLAGFFNFGTLITC